MLRHVEKINNSVLADRIARNLRVFMDRSQYSNPSRLAKPSGVAANTIDYLLHPEKRTLSGANTDGSSKVGLLQKVVAPLGRELWELLHPEPELARRERLLYDKAREIILSNNGGAPTPEHAPGVFRPISKGKRAA